MEPVDKKLYKKVKDLASKKFKTPSGVYRSAWIVREYKKRDGVYSGKKSKSKGITRWFREGWVDINRPIKNTKGKVIGYEKCGRKSTKTKKYPLCRPSKRITKSTPRTLNEISKKSIKKAKREKSKIKGTGNIQFGGFYGSRELKKRLIRNISRTTPLKKSRFTVTRTTSDPAQSKSRFTIIKQSGGAKMTREYCQETPCNKMGFSQKASCKKYKNCYSNAQFHGQQSDIMIKVPSGVKKEAALSFKLSKLGFKGGLETGWLRAKQLVEEEYISIQDLKYMRNWYARHYYTSRPNYMKWIKAGKPLTSDWHNTRSILSYLIWGGESGLKWVNSPIVIKKLNKYFNKNYSVIKNKK